METTSTLRGRVEYLLDLVPGLDAKQLSRLAGLASSHVGQMKRGEVGSLHGDTAEKLALATGASRMWLCFGEGKPPSKRTVAAAIDEARARHDAAEAP